MTNFLEMSEQICVIAFVLTSMGSMGLSLRIQAILEPFKSIRLVVSALLASFVLVPLVAYILTRAILMDQSLATALLLMGTASGAPMLPKLVEFARGNLAQAVGLMALQMAVTILYMPLVLPMMLPGVQSRAWTIARPLLMVVLPSLAAGLLIRTYRKQVADRLQPVLRLASNVALLLLIGVGLAANYSNVHRVAGLEAVVAGTFLLMVSLGLGFVIGGPSVETRKVFALGTAQRNFSVAFLIAVENFRESGVVGTLAILALVASLVLVPSAFGLRKLVGQQEANPA